MDSKNYKCTVLKACCDCNTRIRNIPLMKKWRLENVSKSMNYVRYRNVLEFLDLRITSILNNQSSRMFTIMKIKFTWWNNSNCSTWWNTYFETFLKRAKSQHGSSEMFVSTLIRRLVSDLFCFGNMETSSQLFRTRSCDIQHDDLW